MEREIEFKKKNLNFQQNRGKNRDFIGIKVKSHRPLISNNSISKLDKGSDETNTNSDTNRRKEQRDTNNTKRRKETDFRDKIALGERNAFPLTKARNEREFHAETRLPGRSVEMNSGANCSIQVCVGWPIAL